MALDDLPFDRAKTYRGRPAEAVQVWGEDGDEIVAWLKDRGYGAFHRSDGSIWIDSEPADLGDWIVLRDGQKPRIVSDEEFHAEFDVEED